MFLPFRKKNVWPAAAAVAFLVVVVLGGLALAGRKERPTAASVTGPAPAAVVPGQGTILFQSRADGLWQIFSLDLASGSRTRLTRSSADDYYPSASPDGAWIVFESTRSGMAAVWRMRADGSAAEQLTTKSDECRAPCWDSSATAVLYNSARAGREQIYFLDIASRRERQLTHSFWKSILPAVSADGSLIVFSRNKLGWDVQRMNRDGSQVRALTSKGGNCRPDWSPDGKRIAYVSDVADGKGDVWIMDADGGDKKRLTPGDDSYDYNPAWSPDGRWIVFETTTGSKQGPWSLAVIPVSGGTPALLTPAGADDRYPDWAPDKKNQ